MRWPFRHKAKHKCMACWVESADRDSAKAKWRWHSPYGKIVYLCDKHCSGWMKAAHASGDPLMLPKRLEKL